jgi:hypothetical protein
MWSGEGREAVVSVLNGGGMRFRRDSEKHLERKTRGEWTAHLHAYPSTVAAFLALNDELMTGRFKRDEPDDSGRW